MILIHLHQAATVLLAVIIFLFDSLREKGPVPLTTGQALHVLNILAAHR